MQASYSFKFALLRSLKQRNHNQQGFTLIEVIVAMVILSIFILTSMGALIVGLNLKLKSRLNNEATLALQQDLEQVRYAATQFGLQVASGIPVFTSNLNGTTPLTLSIPVTLVNNQNYLATATAGDQLRIGNETKAYTLALTPQSSSSYISVTADLTKFSTRATTLAANLTNGSSPSSITVVDTSKINIGDRIVVGPDPTNSSNTTIFSATVTGKTATTVAFTAININQSYAITTPVTVLPRSGDVIADISSCSNQTIASSFIASLANVSTVNFNGRSYQITRTATVPSSTRAQFVYDVSDPTVSSSPLASLTTEVIPSVTFQCP